MKIRQRSAAVSVLLVAALLASACSDDDANPLSDTSLGVVTVKQGDPIRILKMSLIQDVGPEALDYAHIVDLAIEDYGPIHGSFTFEAGEMIEDLCDAEHGPQMAEAVLADRSAVGLIGPSCSATSAVISQPVTAAGLAMISFSNTSPLLTSNLSGTPSEHHQPGYYRTAHNDLHQGEAVSAFLHDRLGPQDVAVVHEGDAYTLGLAQAFRDAFERHGGTITNFIEIDSGTTDLDEVLGQLAAEDPDALFFPLGQETAAGFVQGVRQHGAFGDTVLVSADAVLYNTFLGLPSTAGAYIAGPDLDFANRANQATGMNAEQVAERFTDKTGAPPVRAFWAHAYDATTLLLDAVAAASRVEGGDLVIYRAGIRQYLDYVANYQGIIGEISCDGFGDCGTGKISIIEHRDPENPEASRQSVVYRFSPQSPASTEAHE
ncbi:branched-chain amino acid ABC transporter substrate-binding protein [Candidatus Poriferisocius sp.]|uniref:branched-chain amino acid ABC transporter substrate-binding protein n=1 Tax=Candidatus Poriferisocius sp. TaxID=3101276 RepID=UPI003B02645B